MRRSAPVVAVVLGLLLLLGSYVWYSRQVVRELQAESQRTSRMFARVYSALADPRDESGMVALFDLAGQIRELGVPIVVTDVDGRAQTVANLPFKAALNDPRVLEFARELDRQNAPIVEDGVGTIHYGRTRLVRGLRIIPLLQAGLLALLIIGGVVVLITRSRAERERVWAGMARESAHQLGTPLTSLHGWVELLREREQDPLIASAVRHIEGDVERLERVAHRFERIGRPPKRDAIDMAGVVTAVTTYFRARVPTLAHTVRIVTEGADAPLSIPGDQVLLEWALESLIKNAIDALAGVGGTVTVSLLPSSGSGVRVRVSDDGPGIPRELRRRIFSAGFSTKERGWGIGLSLTKRIIEESHGGRLTLLPSDRGALFEIILPG